MAHVKNNSGNEEWYTPERFIKSARRVLGSFDLDPASCETANQVVKADTFFTKEDDGLSKNWSSYKKIWMNPPYSRGVVDDFVDKLMVWAEDDDREAIVLVNNATETGWGSRLLQNSAAVCFPFKRVKFLNESLEEQGKPIQGQMICYIGRDVLKFKAEFKQHGVVMKGTN